MTETKICSYCGATIPADAEICIMCGAPTTPPPTSASIDADTSPPQEVVEMAPNLSTPTIELPQPDIIAPEPVIETREVLKSPSNQGLAVVVEIIAGFFGFLGIGWMISGKLITGIILLIGYWALLLGYIFLIFNWISNTNNWILLSLCCLLPIVPLTSGLILYLRKK